MSKSKGKAKKDVAPAEEPAAAESVVDTVKETVNAAAAAAAPTVEAAVEAITKVAKGTVPKTGETIDLDDFGGEIATNNDEKVTLGKLVQDSKAGVVLFTYPKASTPGCQLYHLTVMRNHILNVWLILSKVLPKLASFATRTSP